MRNDTLESIMKEVKRCTDIQLNDMEIISYDDLEIHFYELLRNANREVIYKPKRILYRSV